MNHRPRHRRRLLPRLLSATAARRLGCTLTVALLVAGFLATLGRPSARAAAPLPNNIVRKKNLDAKDLKAIAKKVSAEIARIASDDPDEQSNGRDALASQAAVSGASTQFMAAFAGDVNNGLNKLAGNEDLRIRLNAAIANARVASRAENGELLEATLSFLGDDKEAVALWGAKAANDVVADEGKDEKRLYAALLAAARKFPNSGPIIEEVYEALVPAEADNPAGVNKVEAARLRVIAAIMLDLLESRVGLYQQGLPPEPAADRAAMRFLVTLGKVWEEGMDEEERTRAVQLIIELAQLAAQNAEVREGDEQDALGELLESAGGTIQVIGQRIEDEGLEGAGEALRLAGARKGNVVAAAEAALEALNNTNQFGTIEPADTLSEDALTTSLEVEAEPVDEGEGGGEGGTEDAGDDTEATEDETTDEGAKSDAAKTKTKTKAKAKAKDAGKVTGKDKAKAKAGKSTGKAKAADDADAVDAGDAADAADEADAADAGVEGNGKAKATGKAAKGKAGKGATKTTKATAKTKTKAKAKAPEPAEEEEAEATEEPVDEGAAEETVEE